MLWRTCSLLLLLLSACTTIEPNPKNLVARNTRIANLQRAVTLPWTDDGHCVVREASNEWPVLVDRCFHALDHKRIRLQDPTGRCAIASAAAAAIGGVGVCILAAPEIAGAVVVIGVVVVAGAIAEELSAYVRRGRPAPEPEAVREAAKPTPQPQPTAPEPVANQRPHPEGSPLGRDWLPPESLEREGRPDCKPVPVPHAGGHAPHNECADKVPQNSFPGWDVLVNGKKFDALQLTVRTLWDVKTDDFDKHGRRSQQFFIEVKLPELQRERRLAEECGYDFVVGVRKEAHQTALRLADPSLKVVVMDWC